MKAIAIIGTLGAAIIGSVTYIIAMANDGT